MSALLFANNLPKLENNKVVFSALGQKPHSNVILGIRFKLRKKKNADKYKSKMSKNVLLTQAVSL